mmetsp:Transcript_29918/g.97480  ORF Transcript_29918/g.97480 Transcript_29918/m.97480 type:complete len:277 (+) Transcript_29918:832-1662(+)
MKGERKPNEAAIVSTGSSTPNMAPYSSILPSRTSTGSSARCVPSTVSSSVSSSACRSLSDLIAEATETGGGGSIASASRGSTSPTRRRLMDRHSCSRGTRNISGVPKSDMVASCIELKRWKQYPSRTRPARPRRCRALARLTHVVTSEDNRPFGSYCVSRTRPVSMTNTTSSMVMEVSAMLVDKTTLRTPSGGVANARCCSSLESVECTGVTMKFSASAPLLNASLRVRISAIPGRKTRIAPSSYSAAMCRTSISMSSKLIFSSSTSIRDLIVSME